MQQMRSGEEHDPILRLIAVPSIRRYLLIRSAIYVRSVTIAASGRWKLRILSGKNSATCSRRDELPPTLASVLAVVALQVASCEALDQREELHFSVAWTPTVTPVCRQDAERTSRRTE